MQPIALHLVRFDKILKTKKALEMVSYNGGSNYALYSNCKQEILSR